MRLSARHVVSWWRLALTSTLLAVINQITELGTDISLLVISSLIGVLIGERLAFSRLRALGFLLALSAALILFRLGFTIGDEILPGALGGSSLFAKFQTHAETIALVFSLSLISTWLFWRLRAAATLEMLILTLAFLSALAGHRNFNFDRPRIVNTLAWQLNVEPIIVIIAFGTLIILTAIIYALIGSHAVRPKEKITLESGKNSLALGTLSIIILVAIFGSVGSFMYQKKPVTNNGVGDKELNFPPGAGRSSQPAAIVRLEGDYKENPWSPMLYLRESAFSKLSGNKLAFVGRAFDSDISAISPLQAFKGDEDSELIQRTPLAQSVYMLVSQENAFAVDYPVSIVQLKNTHPEKFKAAFRAYSMAPAFSRSDLVRSSVGDPRWAPEVRQHYLVKHPDQRYEKLAREITEGLSHPVEKADAITNYLSVNSIYTLSPNHPTPEGEDETAAYLFGDKRGYCIHFAHATVFMLRALGIPARIGSGYLTDLSESKDGHILLRISDRHAWAEVYVTGFGWTPFDTQPQQVEDHANTPVDFDLLEELMGMLDPGEEILPKEESQNEALTELANSIKLPSAQNVGLALLSVLISLFGWKVYLRHGWRLPSSSQTQLKRAYNAFASRCWDLGLDREFGETRAHYERRIYSELGLNFSALTEDLLALKYSHQKGSIHSCNQIAERHFAPLKKLPFWRRCLALINPNSIISSLWRPGW